MLRFTVVAIVAVAVDLLTLWTSHVARHQRYNRTARLSRPKATGELRRMLGFAGKYRKMTSHQIDSLLGVLSGRYEEVLPGHVAFIASDLRGLSPQLDEMFDRHAEFWIHRYDNEFDDDIPDDGLDDGLDDRYDS